MVRGAGWASGRVVRVALVRLGVGLTYWVLLLLPSLRSALWKYVEILAAWCWSLEGGIDREGW